MTTVCTIPQPEHPIGPDALDRRRCVCRHCRQQLETCTGCRTVHHLDQPCLVCTTCQRCGEAHRPDAGIITARGSRICSGCAVRFYQRCTDCESWNRIGDRCGHCDTPPPQLIHPYSYTPTPVFHGDGPLYLGVELEIDAAPERVRELARIATTGLGTQGYLKYDATVSGFEIVTHPMSHAYATRQFPWSLLPELAAAGAQTSPNTGMHVHLSRAGFDGDPHLYRWMKLIYRNPRPVQRLARRQSDYARFSTDERAGVADIVKGTARGYGHAAVNTLHADTIELRVFAASLDPATVRAALGFAAATVDYTRHHQPAPPRDRIWEWQHFARWVTRHGGYPELAAHLAYHTPPHTSQHTDQRAVRQLSAPRQGRRA
ncbi:hypothetical protein NUM_43680 [Actinocatenispora comari]|uniref:Amidoligase enzyme n=2 Tax=Actinocatenispora comari TaxID=2807577 RepID=A0A8J4AD08_9ACTN|nr:hypothetical protein NUM_43680 [Actinocatenispora comari]